MSELFDIVIVGRGAASVALIDALSHSDVPLRIAVCAREMETTAFHRARPEHLLNTRAQVMGVSEQEPNGFADWCAKEGLGGDGRAFQPRRAFARYLDHVFEIARQRALARGGEVAVREQTVRAITATSGGFDVHTDAGTLTARAVVCALGYGAPKSPLHDQAHSPWDAPYDAFATQAAPLLIVGAGLSALDALVSALDAARAGIIHVVSPLGRLPFSIGEEVPPYTDQPPATIAAALRWVRKQSDWRAGVDQLRATTVARWVALSPTQRGALLRSRRMALWSIHRHRAPPGQHAQIVAAAEAGAVRFHAATIVRIESQDDGFVATAQTGAALSVGAVIDARGPSLDLADNPVFQSLIAAGLVRRSMTGVGIMGDEHFALHRDGDAMLFAIGAAFIGERLETTAFPELRAQAHAIARRILAR